MGIGHQSEINAAFQRIHGGPRQGETGWDRVDDFALRFEGLLNDLDSEKKRSGPLPKCGPLFGGLRSR
jgi:hypothetical protein